MRLVLAFLAVLGFAGSAAADEQLPVELPPATGEPHPEGNEFWRVHHMQMMLHERDLTLREGWLSRFVQFPGNEASSSSRP